MRQSLIACVIAPLLAGGSIAWGSDGAPELLPPAPATRSVAASADGVTAAADDLAVDGGGVAPAVIGAAEAAVHRYFYVDFPRRLEALQQQRQLAEAELALIDRRLETYRPMRSFGRYGATYTADAAWQIARLAAVQRLECLRQDETELWRERQVMAAAMSTTR